MGNDIIGILSVYFERYGYWTLAAALLLENAGLPVPGETVLLLASFLAFSRGELHFPYIVLVGIGAATIGDNLGYVVGRWGGRPLLDRYRRLFRLNGETIERGERLFDRYGSITVLFARFVFGLRMIAGPLAGVLRMHWRRFAVFNALGATAWVTSMASLGYLFGRQWQKLVPLLRNANLVLLAVIGLLLIGAWWRHRRETS
jgi:membrane-associated protein